MAIADARRAPAWNFAAKFRQNKMKRDGLAGPARILAEPAYQRLLAAEPVLRRAVPLPNRMKLRGRDTLRG